jgi:tetrahydromethanopterin S-methyltransferase subunit F
VTIESNGSDPSELARVLLVGTSLMFALLRVCEVRGPTRRGSRLYGVDLMLALALVPASGLLEDLVTSLAQRSVLIPLAVGLVAGLAGMATTGLAVAALFAVGSGGTSVLAWFVSPLLIGAALRNVRLKPEMPPAPASMVELELREMRGFIRKLPGGMYPTFPGPSDIFWGLTARLVCVAPLVLVLLISGNGDLKARVAGAALIGGILLAYDRARRPLLMPHRRLARMTDTSVFLVLLVVAYGPLGDLAAQWWASRPSINQWHVALFAAFVAVIAPLVSPRFDGRRLSWLLSRSMRFFVGIPQIMLVCAVFPFLVGGVFHPTQRLMESSAVALAIGLAYGVLTASHSAHNMRSIADVMILLEAPSVRRKRLLDGWVSDNFYRRRGLLILHPWDYSLPRMAVTLAELSAESSRATAGVYLHLPWGDQVRLDHSASAELLSLAEQILDQVDAAFPPTTYGQGTRLYRSQQVARADVATRRSNVAQYLHDFELTVAAAGQAADHYAAINALSHAAVVRVFAADRLSSLGQHETAAALLADIPEDLPPVIRRLLLIIRAASANRAHRTAAARALLTAARAIPARTTLDFRKAFAAEKINFPSFAEGARSAMVTAEIHLDRELGGTHPTAR